MSLWTEIVNTAVIGCERKPLSLSGAMGELGVLLERLDQNDREGALLGAAAIVSLYESASTLPMKDEQPLPKACELDDIPRCSERAATLLPMILRRLHNAPLTEWLRKAAETGVRAPEELLQELLEFGRNQKAWRDDPEEILPVLGARGRWLGPQNPDWVYVTDKIDGGVDETLCDTKRIDERSKFFRALRKRDAARARELLESRWEKETPKNCYEFLSGFICGLSLDDEAFLEWALDDKRYGGRISSEAARLLARLPDSALCRRMSEGARPLLKFKTDDLNRKTIDVMLPEGTEAYDKAMRRGTLKPYGIRDIKKRAGWLTNMLMGIPPKFWLQESGWTVTELIEAANRSEWKDLLIDGWSIAAIVSRDAEWAYALLIDSIDNDRDNELWLQSNHRRSLFYVLPQSRQESLAIEELRTHPSLHTIELPPSLQESLAIGELKTHISLRATELPYGFIYLCNKKWGEDLSRAVIDWLLHQLVTSGFENIWRPFFKYDAPRLLNPALIPETISRITAATKPPGQRAPTIEDFLNVIQARYEMLNAF